MVLGTLKLTLSDSAVVGAPCIIIVYYEERAERMSTYDHVVDSIVGV